MPNYSGTYATPRLDLGRAMWEYMLGSQSFIGTRVLPIFSTMKKEASFSKITRESILRSRNVKRAPRSAYSRDTYDAKDQTFNCEERGHEQPLDDTERSLYASDFDAESAAAKIAAQVVLQEQEKDIADMIFNTTTWTGAALYTDRSAAPWLTASSDIIGHVDAAKDKVRIGSGMRANALIISYGVLTGLKANTAIKDAIKYTAIPTEDQIIAALSGLFGLRHIIVGDHVKNSAKEGQAFSGADIWSATYAMIARVCETQDLTEPGIGRTMLWAEESPSNATVEEYREEQTRSWVYRARHHADEVVFDANYGHLLKIA